MSGMVSGRVRGDSYTGMSCGVRSQVRPGSKR